MKTPVLVALLSLACSACGVADTATATATVAEARKQELENARAMQQRIQEDIAASQQAAQDRIKAIDAQAR